ncbi:hypothetical protein [Anaeroselena agilis]|uniref:Antitoxin VbhA domain-containing protein n=1 Tax=Anaeroselena agilis TaxID=3063788 RepID=A0ABU3NTM2_9FIRM|nr:hypothetical protein [Selenomonadales bacterium 4137-cl]
MVRKKTDSEAFASEYAMSAGDNAVSREQIDRSIVAGEVANEHSFRAACMRGLDDISQDRKNDRRGGGSV